LRRYFTSTAIGWPFGVIMTTKLLYGAVLLALRGHKTVLGGTQCASPPFRLTVSAPGFSRIRPPSST